jgi:SH3-like domain-containing protein
MKLRMIWLLFLFCCWSLPVTAGERLAVKVPVANVRAEPGTKSAVLWNIGRYHPIEVIGRSGSWYHFRDFEGDQGWLHDTLVDETPSIITRVDNCNVRSGPGTEFAVSFTVDSGIPFKVIGRKGEWLQIEHADGDRGWVHKALTW